MKINKKILYILIILIIILLGIIIYKNVIKKSKNGNNMSSQEIVDYILNKTTYTAKISVQVNSNKNTNKYILNLSSEDEIRLINVLTKANYFSISIYNYIKSIATGKYLIGSDSKDYRLKYFKNTYDNYILELGIYISNTIERYLKTSNDQWWSFSL